ncbi:hypothetical protein BDL97_11G066000 [Sphagnum fallax]|nr:hypothetical protein BDL97_11G066000 [Sphagnum fallax]
MVGMFMNRRSFKVVGRCVHDQIIESGCDSNVFVESSLVDIIPDVGVYHFQMWSLGAFEMWVRAEGTLELFQKMQHKGVQSNYVTICGMCPHDQIIQIGWDSDVFVGSSLVDIVQQDVILDVVTEGASFVCLLLACSHVGLVDEGMHYYASMTAAYNVHDLCKFGISLAWSTFLAVFGHLQEAENMIKGMTSKPYFIELELENAVGYVLLSNYIYAELLAIGNYVQNVQWQRRERGEKKQQGPTRIGMNNMAFVVDNQDYPQMIEICSQLMRLLGLIHDVGYATQGLFLAMSNLVMWYHWKKQPSHLVSQFSFIYIPVK